MIYSLTEIFWWLKTLKDRSIKTAFLLHIYIIKHIDFTMIRKTKTSGDKFQNDKAEYNYDTVKKVLLRPINPNPLGIFTRNLPESFKILNCAVSKWHILST